MMCTTQLSFLAGQPGDFFIQEDTSFRRLTRNASKPSAAKLSGVPDKKSGA